MLSAVMELWGEYLTHAPTVNFFIGGGTNHLPFGYIRRYSSQKACVHPSLMSLERRKWFGCTSRVEGTFHG